MLMRRIEALSLLTGSALGVSKGKAAAGFVPVRSDCSPAYGNRFARASVDQVQSHPGLAENKPCTWES